MSLDEMRRELREKFETLKKKTPNPCRLCTFIEQATGLTCSDRDKYNLPSGVWREGCRIMIPVPRADCRTEAIIYVGRSLDLPEAIDIRSELITNDNGLKFLQKNERGLFEKFVNIGSDVHTHGIGRCPHHYHIASSPSGVNKEDVPRILLKMIDLFKEARRHERRP